ncbi:MAG TPA: glycoside hydrolase [Cyanobacteria bacterium UBA11149]|nr:glycoside hydrolase [Cyanobacteria bacterium UBA11367]HBE60956.1 glycoside hydrolase [Cyanobacteria bacterium UBA11366]HBK64584.1 glycoside hydrolase [Cyanobacteria bacterium UBA11166]HBR76655.1 glycoside hydrolase [Cyanobacteria bacterium UBA11159]HBS69553.1 glycoside hydrolase [Cyanobacteria bacterium UBA11153]HBW87537.1 glycoside hydrolase [Cyanobacteria bacterium UBA11149]HCA97004.1 glycoside hydrolase [Cyanobacteria bacterium UBA9226]
MFQELSESHRGEYCCRTSLNLYDSPTCSAWATQVARGRHLQVLSQQPETQALQVRLCEDGYVAWLRVEDVVELERTDRVYQAIALSRTEIQQRIPEIINFAKNAMLQPNYYLWGGTLGPNYDCSGLIQAAFAASGIWLPRDSYQQAAFTQNIAIEELLAGDLVFFGTPEKVNHVGLYLGDGCYIHSSGKDKGRNGIAIDLLSGKGDPISQSYYRQFKQAGRVMVNYLVCREDSHYS